MERKSRFADPWKALLLPAIIVIGALACYLYFNKGITEYREGHENGYSAGYDDGYETGYDEGYEAGKADGYESGKDAGYETGYTEGYLDGRLDGRDAEDETGQENKAEDQSYSTENYGTESDNSESYDTWTPPTDRWVPSWANPDQTVYVSNRSHTIHSIPNCSGMKNYIEMTFWNAVEEGYDFCLNCW